MTRGFWAGLSLIFLSFQSSAIQAVVSHTVFYQPGAKGSPYVEIYWQVDPQSLHYVKTAKNTWATKIITDIVVKSGNSIVATDKYLLETAPATSLGEATNQPIIDLRHISIPPGNIQIELTLTDIEDTLKKFVFADSFSVQQDTGVYYSEVQLLDTSYSSDEKTIFQKDHKQQIPLCADFLDNNKVMLHYYCEMYNANSIVKDIAPLVQKIFISRQEGGGPVFNLIKQDTVLYASLQPVNGSFLIDVLPSGNYYLNFNLVNKDQVIVASKSLFFQRYNNKPKTNVEEHSAKSDTTFQPVIFLDLHKTFVMQYTLPELKAILKMILPVATPLEVQAIKGFLANPDENYMRYFIYNHFAGINKKAPEAAWKEFTVRIKEVNKQFSAGSTPGFETDRGYIYLKYGKPDEIVTVENERGALPYEIWQYNNINNQYKNAIFLFYRPADMISGFRLLHSTLSVEMRNASWRDLLFINGSQNNNTNSRAEQYVGNR